MLHSNVDRILNDPLVEVSNDALDDAELLEKLAASVEYLVGEDVLLAVDPEIGEAFLGGVEDLGQIAEAALLVKDFVCLRELFTVGSWCAVCLENFAKTLDLVQETLAGSLAILRVEVVLLISSLLQVIAHHNGVFEQEEVWTATKFFNLSEGPRRCSLCTNRNQLRELKVILADVISVLAVDA